MGTIQSHRDLEAWHVAMDLTTETYRLTERFPSKEMYGLQSQMRRAAVSVPSNVAEGQAQRFGSAIHYLSIALGSLAELDTQCEVGIRLAYLSEEGAREFRRLHESSRRLVSGLRRSKRLQIAGTAVRTTGIVVLMLYATSCVLA